MESAENGKTNMTHTAPTPLLDDIASLVSFQNSRGLAMQAALLRLAPHSVAFELASLPSTLQLSEVLSDFKILADKRSIYQGKAVVTSLVNAGNMIVCEAALEGALQEAELFQPGDAEKNLRPAFSAFMARWQNFYKILPEFKTAVVDLQSFLQELRLWLDQIEVGIRRLPGPERAPMENAILKELLVQSSLDALFERFELVAAQVPAELIPAHRWFCHRQLHGLLLSAPFTNRIFTKPLGYAGDYEMIDMIIRDGYEGSSLFAKLLHAYIIQQAPAVAVRNRALYFTKKFVEETCRVASLGRVAHIYSLGCGPAREVESFMAEHALSDRAQFSLLDFNEETLAHTGSRLEQVKRKHHRQTVIQMVRKSVYALLKEKGRSAADESSYDVIYCSGLYDYLDDRMCQRLNTYLYNKLRPGGTLIVTNFDPSNPIRNLMEFAFEWFLIHRDGKQIAATAPDQAGAEDYRVVAEYTGCNIFLEVRKPELKR